MKMADRAVLLASSLLLLSLVPLANAQSGDAGEDFILMNGLSSGRDYIVYLTWWPNDPDGNAFVIFIHDSATDKQVSGIKYDIAMYKDGRLVESTQRLGQTVSRQVYDLEEMGRYTIRIDNINGEKEGIDFSIQVTPEFPLGLFAGMAALLAAVATAHRFRRQLFMV